ncbi:TOM1-like protein 3 [Magnolia sinica]|uniref:TOM1-like protein 3 n=1 Tax=Magnolia sinica TaxID=86752 RepID=UPI00265801C1|nr:TOM1-like protein 3 [Magnolia sinica]
MANAAECVERATSDMLIGPDWGVNIEICDIINMDPGQAKDAMKVLKKQLLSKNPQIQLLALVVIETLTKNCGDSVHVEIIECDILNEMVNIVKKKPALNVREKILILIDTWQAAFGGARGKYPQYDAAYNELKSAGVDFPPRAENTVPLFTPPHTQPSRHHSDASTYNATAFEASIPSNSSALSMAEIQNARGIVDVLTEMFRALDPHSSEGVNQEIIVELVEQCQSYQKNVTLLVSSTEDEELLRQGLTLNDNLQRVLRQHDDILKGIYPTGTRATETSVAPLANVNHEDDESDDEFSQLAHRSSRNSRHGQDSKPADARNKQTYVTPLIPPPPSSKKATPDTSSVDYLSGDAYRSEQPFELPKTTTFGDPLYPSASVSPYSTPTPPPSSPPSRRNDSTPSPLTPQLPDHVKVEPLRTEKSTEWLPLSAWEAQSSGSLLPPPSKSDQRHQFIGQQQQGSQGRVFHSSGSGSSDDGLAGRTQNLSLHQTSQPSVPQDSSPLTMQNKPEDSLFKDLFDFAKVKSSSSAKPGGH